MRLHPFGSLAGVAETLETLAQRELVARLERRPGQKEDRYAQLLGAGEEQGSDPQGQTLAVDRLGEVEARLAMLEAAFAQLSSRLDR